MAPPVRTAMALLVLAPMLAGCSTQGPAGDPAVWEGLGRGSIPWQEGHPAVETLTVLGSESSWEEFWSARHGGNVTVPEVDFTRRVVVALVGARAPNPGHSVWVQDVRHLDGSLVVDWLARTPGEGCRQPTVVSSPHSYVTVVRQGTPVPEAQPGSVTRTTYHCR